MGLISLFFVLNICSVALVVSLTIAVIIAVLLSCSGLIFLCYKKRTLLVNWFLRATRRTQTPERTTVREGLQMFDFPGGGAPTGQTGLQNPLKNPTTHPRM
jgi:hypothetical protein